MEKDSTKPLSKVIRIDESEIRGHLGSVNNSSHFRFSGGLGPRELRDRVASFSVHLLQQFHVHVFACAPTRRRHVT